MMVTARIIPAFAGNTTGIFRSLWNYWGSSPHSRGTRILKSFYNDIGGIIPAFAGNTYWESGNAFPI